MKNQKNHNEKLECGNCGSNLKLESPPDGVIIFACEECGKKLAWKINNLANKIEKYPLPDESAGIEFTKMEKSIVKIAIITIIFLSILLLFYVLIKR